MDTNMNVGSIEVDGDISPDDIIVSINGYNDISPNVSDASVMYQPTPDWYFELPVDANGKLINGSIIARGDDVTQATSFSIVLR